jgi:hypothetical protein
MKIIMVKIINILYLIINIYPPKHIQFIFTDHSFGLLLLYVFKNSNIFRLKDYL